MLSIWEIGFINNYHYDEKEDTMIVDEEHAWCNERTQKEMEKQLLQKTTYDIFDNVLVARNEIDGFSISYTTLKNSKEWIRITDNEIIEDYFECDPDIEIDMHRRNNLDILFNHEYKGVSWELNNSGRSIEDNYEGVIRFLERWDIFS